MWAKRNPFFVVGTRELAFFWLFVLALLADVAPIMAKTAPEKPQAKIAYTVALTGIDKTSPLVKSIKAVSRLYGEKDKLPDTLFMLEDRARDDSQRVRQYLRGEGYFAARVKARVGTPKAGKPARVVLNVRPGPLYKLRPVVFRIRDGRPPLVPTEKDLGLAPGAPGRSQVILDGQDAIPVWYAARGYPFAKVLRRRVVVDHTRRSVAVRFAVRQGRRVRIGAVVVRGAPGVKRWIIQRRLGLRRGDLFTSAAIAAARERLLALGVFSSVTIAADPRAIRPDGIGRIFVTLKERKRRTLSVRAFYDTSLGPGGEVEWLHRNLFGAAEKLRLRVGGTLSNYGVRAIFDKPHIFDSPYNFVTDARYAELDAPAYKGREGVIELAISRQFSPRLWAKVGPVFDWSFFQQENGGKAYRLFGISGTLLYDASDNKLDPRSGYRLRLDVAPYVGAQLSFARFATKASLYWTPGQQRAVTLAGWTRLAFVLGAKTANLPPNKRLYAGGGNSVRGFSFQRVGPLNSADNPVGGRSLLEGGLEARIRFNKEWGAVAFVEAGMVSRDLLFGGKQEGQRVQLGVGLGLRYTSPIGLIRLDVATPLRRRKGDNLLQIYISLGQAF